MSNLCLHCNAEKVVYEDLTKVILPEDHPKFKDKCGRYGSVPHHRLVDAVRVMSTHLFGKDTITDEQFGLSTGDIYPGARFFGLFKFDIDGTGVEQRLQTLNELAEDIELTDADEIKQELEDGQKAVEEIVGPKIADDSIYPAFAIRNSHDRSMCISAALGHNCFICDNLALSGDVMFARKHTVNAMQDVLLTFWSLMKTMKEQFIFDTEFRDATRATEITNDYGYELLGRMAGNGALSFEGGNKSQFAMAMKEWKTPRFDVFEPRTMWSLYNAVTFAQRKAGIGRRLEAGSSGSAIIRNAMDEVEMGNEWSARANEITSKYKNPSRATMLELLDIITALPQAEKL